MHDYSVKHTVIGKKSHTVVSHMRVQVPVEVTGGWTQIMVFSEPQDVEVTSAEAVTKWNCRKTILFVQDRGYNGHIKAQKSYNMRFVFHGMKSDDLLGNFKLYFFDGHPENVDCYADDYRENYCGEVVTTTKPILTTSTTTTTTTTASTTTKPTPACKTPAQICLENGDGHFKVCDCYHYVQCWNGGKNASEKRKCPAGTIWNSVIQVCDWEVNVKNCAECDCKPTQPPTTTTQPWTGKPTTRAPTPAPAPSNCLSGNIL